MLIIYYLSMTHNKNTFDKKLNSFNNFTKNWIARDRQRVVQLNWVRVRHGELLRGLETSREPQTYLCKCAACYLACRMRCHHVECGQAVGCSNEPDILQCERHIKGRYLRISNGIFFFFFLVRGERGSLGVAHGLWCIFRKSWPVCYVVGISECPGNMCNGWFLTLHFLFTG